MSDISGQSDIEFLYEKIKSLFVNDKKINNALNGFLSKYKQFNPIFSGSFALYVKGLYKKPKDIDVYLTNKDFTYFLNFLDKTEVAYDVTSEYIKDKECELEVYDELKNYNIRIVKLTINGIKFDIFNGLENLYSNLNIKDFLEFEKKETTFTTMAETVIYNNNSLKVFTNEAISLFNEMMINNIIISLKHKGKLSKNMKRRIFKCLKRIKICNNV